MNDAENYPCPGHRHKKALGLTMVYLLHFEKPISDNHTCQHYIGSTDNLEQRLAKHRQGLNGREGGARLTQVAVERNINFVVARTWEGGKEEEKRLKRQKQGPKLCPICKRNLR